jgi:hypothetical protein
MRHSLRLDHAACPRPFDGVDAGLDSDFVGEVVTVPTIRARRLRVEGPPGSTNSLSG